MLHGNVNCQEDCRSGGASRSESHPPIAAGGSYTIIYGRGTLDDRAVRLFLPLSLITPLLRQGFALPAPPWGKLSFCLAYGKAGRRIQKRNAVIDKDRNVMCTINKTNIENIYKNTY